MKLLIFGKNSFICTEFVKILDTENINYICSDVRINIINKNQIYNVVQNSNVTNVISFIGRTNSDKINSIDCLESRDRLHDNINDNLLAPIILADICQKLDVHFTYIGSGCIFNYTEDLDFVLKYPHYCYKYNENDEPTFFGSNYSVVKGLTDTYFRHNYTKILNCRIRMPITDFNHPRDFITKIVSYKDICSMPNSMTVLSDLLPYLLKLIQTYTIGTINLVNPGLISHNEILELYKEIIDNKHTWNNITCAEQNNLLKSERSNCALNSTKIETLFPDIKNIKDSVKNILYKRREQAVREK